MTRTTQETIDLVERCWGEDEDTAYALTFFLEDQNKINDVVTNDLIFNRYNTIDSWKELASAILNDDALIDELDPEYREKLEEFVETDHYSEKEIGQFFIKDNWAFDEDNCVAIGFDDEIDVTTHER